MVNFLPTRLLPEGTTKYSSVVSTLMLSTDREKKTGVNHFKRFRESCGLAPHMQPHENSTSVFMDFIAYMMVELDKVRTYAAVKKYISHVKMWHVQLQLTPGPLYGIKLELPDKLNQLYAMFGTEVNNWYKDLDEGEKGKRIPTTTGVLQYLVKGEGDLGGTWDITDWDNYRMWASELICIFSGARKGELLVKKVNGRDTKKDCKISDVQMSKDYIQIFVHDKVTQKRLPIYVARKEVEPIVERFGQHFDIFKILKTIIAQSSSPNELLFVHKNRTPITYNQYWKRITNVATLAGMPPGTIGGHGGRIRLATLLDIRNVNEVDIKGRGRWSSKCWQIYVRMFMDRPPPTAFWFRIGQLNIDLSSFPPVSEFRK